MAAARDLTVILLFCSIRAAAAKPWAKPGFKDARSTRSRSWARGTIYEEGKEGQCDCDPDMKPSCVCAAVEAERRARDGDGRLSPAMIGIIILSVVGAVILAIVTYRHCGTCARSPSLPSSGTAGDDQHHGNTVATSGGPSAAPSAPEYPSGGFAYPPDGRPQQQQQQVHQMMPSYYPSETAASSSQAPPPGEVVMGIPTKN